MSFKINAPEKVHASIDLPASKSISNRVLVINALTDGRHVPSNLSVCDDTHVMQKALAGNSGTVDIRAAGTAMRFLTAYYSLTEGSRSLTGTQRMRQRPIRILVDALRQLGADIRYEEQEGFPPLHICGRRLEGKELSIPGNVSSQYISALMLIAPCMENGLLLKLTGNIVSRPYIELTMSLMRTFGAEAGWLSEDTIRITPRRYTSVPFKVESDWSAASYWYEIVALSAEAEVELTGLFANSCQGDSKVAELFRPLGVETRFTERGTALRKTPVTSRTFDYDFVEQPDLAQTFVVTCALSGIPFRFSGLQSLKIKETDRIAALIREMKKLGYILHEKDGSVLYWEGEYTPPTAPPAIDTYEDHRMAMAFAPASLRIPGLVVRHPEVVSKSYPDYWSDLRKAGFRLTETD